MKNLNCMIVLLLLVACDTNKNEFSKTQPQSRSVLETKTEIYTTVNVNEADAQTIADVLKGVGLKRAQAIVAYRERHGKFYTLEELTAVRGIGKSTVARNKDRITLAGPEKP